MTGKITVRVGLQQGSPLSPYLFDMILGVMRRGIKEQPPGVCCLQTIVLCSTRRENGSLEERGLKMEEYGIIGVQYAEIHCRERQ